MGHIYHKAKGVDKDVYEAMKWYRKAAKRGHRKAKKRLRKLENKFN